MNGKTACIEWYTALVGLAALVLGAMDILVWAGAYSGIEIGIMSVGGNDFFRWAWGGLVVVFGGILMLAGARNIRSVQQFAKAVCGAMMVWIIAGTDIFAIICENIPAGEDSPEFFNSIAGFVGAFAPPHSPAILLLPLTLIFVLIVWKRGCDGE